MTSLLVALVLIGVGFFVYKKFIKENNNTTASVTLSVGDVPSIQKLATNSDSIESVFVKFAALEIQPASGERISFTFDSKIIDLMSGINNTLLDGHELPVGDYSWIRLMVVENESYVIVNGAQESLFVPSGSQSGLKLTQGFGVGEAGADFTIDFNLEKSLVKTGKGEYMLKPVLKLIDNLAPVEEPPIDPTV
jgi:hypothetical protein